MTELTLNIVTPKCTYGPFECDSVHLTLADDLKGKGGGDCGIRKGHEKALLALEEGPVKALENGNVVLAGKGGCGFATVDKDVVTVVIEMFCVEE